MISPNIPNKLTRRNWLRNAALTATGVAVLPSFFIGCTDHVVPGPGDLLDPTPITEGELRSAAQNLLHMNAWVEDVYLYTGNYEQYVIELLKSGPERPKDWTNFIITILTDIAIGIIGVAAASVPGLGPAIGAAVAIVSENIKAWTAGSLPHNLDAEFAVFKDAHLQMQLAISDMLLKLADKTDNYRNLQEGWKGEIDFNGKKYTIKDLASSEFPTVDKGTAFVDLRTAAINRFKKYIWNLMTMKAGNMTYYHIGTKQAGWYDGGATGYVRKLFYESDENYAASYIRGSYNSFLDSYIFEEFYFEFDGRRLTAAAAKELFKDDVRGHIINPDGLFNRDYFYKQFHIEKPDFFGYYDVSLDEVGHGTVGNRYLDFDESADNYEFTGGDFPQLIKK